MLTHSINIACIAGQPYYSPVQNVGSQENHLAESYVFQDFLIDNGSQQLHFLTRSGNQKKYLLSDFGCSESLVIVVFDIPRYLFLDLVYQFT